MQRRGYKEKVFIFDTKYCENYYAMCFLIEVGKGVFIDFFKDLWFS